MTDDAAWAIAWTVAPDATREPTPAAPNPAALTARMADVGGYFVPVCSRIGHDTALSQIVEPIDPLAPDHDPIHLLPAARATEHKATVLAHAVFAAPLRES